MFIIPENKSIMCVIVLFCSVIISSNVENQKGFCWVHWCQMLLVWFIIKFHHLPFCLLCKRSLTRYEDRVCLIGGGKGAFGFAYISVRRDELEPQGSKVIWIEVPSRRCGILACNCYRVQITWPALLEMTYASWKSHTWVWWHHSHGWHEHKTAASFLSLTAWEWLNSLFLQLASLTNWQMVVTFIQCLPN